MNRNENGNAPRTSIIYKKIINDHLKIIKRIRIIMSD